MWGPPARLLSNQGPEFLAELNCELLRQWEIKRQDAIAYLLPQTNRQVEWFNRTLKTMIAKFMNGRQERQLRHLPARAATELILMDTAGIAHSTGGGQEAHFGKFGSEQQDPVESAPHRLRRSTSSVTRMECRAPRMALRLVGEVKAVAFPWNSNPHILGIPVRDELCSFLNKNSLPSSSRHQV